MQGSVSSICVGGKAQGAPKPTFAPSGLVERKCPDDLGAPTLPCGKSVGAWSRRDCHPPRAVSVYSLGRRGFCRLKCVLRTNTYSLIERVWTRASTTHTFLDRSRNPIGIATSESRAGLESPVGITTPLSC